MTLSERLTELRGDNTLSMVADSIYVAVSSVHEWETGKRMPNIRFLAMLADYYGVSLSEMFDNVEVEF